MELELPINNSTNSNTKSIALINIENEWKVTERYGGFQVAHSSEVDADELVLEGMEGTEETLSSKDFYLNDTEGIPPITEFAAFKIYVKDLRASKKFYEKLGFHECACHLNQEGMYILMKFRENGDFILWLQLPEDSRISKPPSLVFVPDPEVKFSFSDALTDLCTAGVIPKSVKRYMTMVKVERSTAQFSDPDGNSLTLINNTYN